ncbi:MAG: radical SAM protein [Clostridia bacterium]|nr:radical SAM protein [Clostridia bacterium]
MLCSLCPRSCKAERLDNDGQGICHSPALPRVARAALHFGEEPCISGVNGSGTVFFSGCPLNCRFCQNHSISHENYGKTISIERLADIFRELVAQGAHNINLVNPTHFALAIRQALDIYRPPVPIVYNSSGYESLETLRALEGYVDVYLPDLKYLDDGLAASLSGVGDYAAYATKAVLEMARQTGPVQLDDNGIAQKGTIVRHLVLPGHTRASMEVLEWLHDHLPSGTYISVLLQYTPFGNLPSPLDRPLTLRECRKIKDFVEDIGIDGYIQQHHSDGAQYVPIFDLTGV